MKITTFEQVNRLYKKGLNLCAGCPFENYATCNEERLEQCNKQLQDNKETYKNMFRKYRFSTAERETMKERIITHLRAEGNAQSLHILLKWNIYSQNKKKAYKAKRELYLYKSLTENDLPNF